MDILLINPPREIPQQADFMPMGLAYIAAGLRKNGIDTGIIDASSYSWAKLGKVIKEHSPKIAGFSCWTIERQECFRAARLAKELLPDVKIICGGHHATALPEHMFTLANADAVVMGEGEETTLALVKALLNGDPLSGINGIAYKNGDKIVVNPAGGFTKNLDDMPFPVYGDFDFDEYIGLPEVNVKAAALITSRGCPYKCTFCSAPKFWERKWRYRSAENVLDEIEMLYRDYGVKGYMFFDDNFAINKERAIKICEGIIERAMNIRFVICSHVNQINEEVLKWMKKAGCYRIDFGVESGSPKMLKNIKKGQTVEQIRRAFKMTHAAGINPRAYLMVGNPGEDETTIQETVDLMKEIKPFGTTSGQILWVLPDTELYELAKSQGIVNDDFWLKDNTLIYYTSEKTPDELRKLRDQLMRGLAANEGTIKSQLDYIMKKFYYKYPVSQKFRKVAERFRRTYENIAY